MIELWKPVPFAPSYQASNFGQLIGKRGKIMNPTLTAKGYYVCDLNYIQHRVHRVICITFHGDPPSLIHHAAHKDSDSTNNHADNLYWATPLENARDLLETERNNGENAWKAILKETDVLDIRRLHANGVWCRDISKKYPQVEYVTIQAIIHRRSWKHLP